MKKEFTKFLKFYRGLNPLIQQELTESEVYERYQEFLNSEPKGEVRSVSENEDQVKRCQNCRHKYLFYKKEPCSSCDARYYTNWQPA